MTKTMTWTGFSPVLIAIWLTVSSKSSLAFSMLLCVVASDSANNKRHKLFFMHKKVINFFNPNFWNFWCLEVRIKSILARNLLIYLDLHCVRRSSWTVTTLATLFPRSNRQKTQPTKYIAEWNFPLQTTIFRKWKRKEREKVWSYTNISSVVEF